MLIKVPYLNLDRTFNSGQSLRWFKIESNRYILRHKEKMVYAEMKKNDMLYIGCSEDDFFDIWYHYFAIDIDYQEIHRRIHKNKDIFNGVSKASKGVRVLRKDPNEVLIKYIFKKAYKEYYKEYFELFCQAFGKRRIHVHNGAEITWYTCPTFDKLPTNLKDLKKSEFAFNNKALKYIAKIARDIQAGLYAIEDIPSQVKELKVTYLSTKMANQLQSECFHKVDKVDLSLPEEKLVKRWLVENGYESTAEDYDWLLESYELDDIKAIARSYIINYQKPWG